MHPSATGPARTAPGPAALEAAQGALLRLEVDLVLAGVPVDVELDDAGGVLRARQRELVVDVRGPEVAVELLAAAPDGELAVSVATVRLEGALPATAVSAVLQALVAA